MTNKWGTALSAVLAVSAVCGASSFTVSGGVPSAFVSRGQTAAVSSSALAMARRRGRPRGPLRTIIEKPPMNDEIEYDEVRVVVLNPSGGKDEPVGVMSKPEALAKAKEMGGLDLILVNVNSQPPVCKIADYSKYRYMEEKKKKEKKKASKSTEVKEVKMSYKIDVHDYEVRKKNAAKFIQQGNRVKCSVMFRGREIQHDKLGYELLDKIALDLEKICIMEGKPKREGRAIACIMSPRPEVQKAVNTAKRAEEKAKKKAKEEKQAKARAATAAAAAGGAAEAAATMTDEDIDLSALGEDDDDDDSSLDELLGGDALTDELFG